MLPATTRAAGKCEQPSDEALETTIPLGTLLASTAQKYQYSAAGSKYGSSEVQPACR